MVKVGRCLGVVSHVVRFVCRVRQTRTSRCVKVQYIRYLRGRVSFLNIIGLFPFFKKFPFWEDFKLYWIIIKFSGNCDVRRITNVVCRSFKQHQDG
jgi:hypothetical protein